MSWGVSMHILDASSIIHGWDNYPVSQFPGLWNWLKDQIVLGELAIPVVAMDEVGQAAPDCAAWLKEAEIDKLSPNNDILSAAMKIKDRLEIIGDEYHPKGVGENDILIVATAYYHESTLISNEGRQTDTPKVRSKFKIPLVCSMGLDGTNVKCITFLEYLKQSKETFS